MFYTIDNKGKIHSHNRFMFALTKCQVWGHKMCNAIGELVKY